MIIITMVIIRVVIITMANITMIITMIIAMFIITLISIRVVIIRLIIITVIIITGDTDSHMSVDRYWKIHQDGTPKLIGYGLDSFKDFIVDWYLVADTFEEGHPVTM
jgi:hypothetical protein